jgi:hypothetical protein
VAGPLHLAQIPERLRGGIVEFLLSQYNCCFQNVKGFAGFDVGWGETKDQPADGSGKAILDAVLLVSHWPHMPSPHKHAALNLKDDL